MALLRTLIGLAVVAALVYGGATVKLGKRTFFGHIAHIWESDEAQELVEGVKETSGPMVERVKRGVQAGVEEASRDQDAADEQPGRRDRDRRDPDGDQDGSRGDQDRGDRTDADPERIVTHPTPGQ